MTSAVVWEVVSMSALVSSTPPGASLMDTPLLAKMTGGATLLVEKAALRAAPCAAGAGPGWGEWGRGERL